MNNSSKMKIKDTCFYVSTSNVARHVEVDANKFALQQLTYFLKKQSCNITVTLNNASYYWTNGLKWTVG